MFSASKTGLRPLVIFSTERSKAAYLLKFIFVCTSVVSNMAFVVYSFVCLLLISPRLGAAERLYLHSAISWVSSHICLSRKGHNHKAQPSLSTGRR